MTVANREKINVRANVRLYKIMRMLIDVCDVRKLSNLVKSLINSY